MADAGDLARQELGRHLRRSRRSLGWTLDSLAERLEAEGTPLDPSTISRIEKGQTTPTLDIAGGLARCLGTSVAALDEVLRSARRRKTVDITGRSFEKLMESGKRQVSKGDIRAALDYFEAARDWVELHPEAENRNDKLAQALILEAKGQLRLRNVILANELTGRALNLPRIPPDTQLTALLVQTQICYRSLDFARASAFAREAEPLLQSAAGSVRAFAFAVLGDLHYMREDFSAAIPWLEKAREAYRALRDARELLRTQITLGYALHKHGHPENGLRIAREALRGAQEEGFKDVTFFGFGVIGQILMERDDSEQSRRHLKKAQELARSLGLATDEFAAYYYLWRWSQKFGTRTDAARCVRAMRQLLHRADRSRPEVTSFLASVGSESFKGGR